MVTGNNCGHLLTTIVSAVVVMRLFQGSAASILTSAGDVWLPEPYSLSELSAEQATKIAPVQIAAIAATPRTRLVARMGSEFVG